MTEEQAKWVLYNAIMGQSSRLVIASMNPELMAIQHMEFREYLRRMGEKFTPAAESIQMEAEYRSRKQGKNEDVQNYSTSTPSTSCSSWRSQMPRSGTGWSSTVRLRRGSSTIT